MMPNWVKAAMVVVFLGLAVYVVVRIIPPRTPPQDECALLVKQHAATVDLQATVKDLEFLKGKIGVTAGVVQEVDTILKDYGFKYEAACRDNRRKAISDAEYNCRRDNFDKTLSAARTLGMTLNEIKNIQDPGVQKDVILKNIETIQALAKADFSAGCGSAMAVSPGNVTFKQTYPERTITLVNGGNREAVYQVTGLPEAFVAHLASGKVAAGGGTVVVSIMRTQFPVAPGADIVFYVSDNFGHRVPVHLQVDAENAALYEGLAQRVKDRAAEQGREPTVEDALAAVTREWPQIKEDGARYLYASGALMQASRFDEAVKGLDALSRADPALYSAPGTQLLAGLSYYRTNQFALAMKRFSATGSGPAAEDERTEAFSRVFMAAVLLSEGKDDAASKQLATTEVQSAIRNDPQLLQSFKGVLGPADTRLVNAIKAGDGKMF